MQNIILISGFGGSGKSTCAQLLWERLDAVAMVEADHLFRIQPFDLRTSQGREQIGRIKLRNSLAVATTFVEEGFANILMEGLVWSQHELDAVGALAKEHECATWCFWLKTAKHVRHERVRKRARDEADTQAFLDTVEKEITDPTPLQLRDGRYHEISTDTLQPEEVVDTMVRFLSEERSN